VRCVAVAIALGLLALVSSAASPAVTLATTAARAPAPPRAHARAITGTSATTRSTESNAPIPVPASDEPPAGRRLSANEVLAIASRLKKVRAVRAKYPGSYGGAYLRIPFRWQVSFFSRSGKKEIGQVIIDDASGRVLEAWTGFQVAWTMARGYPGAFGRHVNSLYIWLPMCALFFFAFFDFRRPLRLLHLDLLVLLSFSISLAFFNHAHIYASVPLAYPPLLYLLARMLALVRSPRPVRAPPLRLLVPARWLAVAVVFLIGFRVALNVTDSNVIDVGYAGVIGAQRIVDGKPLYGGYPRDNEHGDTYGPVNYAAYVPAEVAFGFNNKWDDLPAAHAAAIAFDLLAAALLFLLGRRVRGPALGIALAYAWVSYPFTLFSLQSNSNDALVAVLVLAAVLAAGSRSRLRSGASGALAALAGLTKFAPLALAPLLALHDPAEDRRAHGAASSARALTRSRIAFLLTFAGAAVLALGLALAHDSLATFVKRTYTYQANRESPFSVWGLYSGLAAWQRVAQVAGVALALVLAVAGRRRDLAGLAAACAAVLIAVQLGVSHWFYLYIPWFFGLVMLALLARLSPENSTRGAASGSARSRTLAAVPSSG
jgi:Glycosyltransferase family 87